MDPGSDSSPIVILASFLIFLSYIYHKVWQPRHRSFEEEKIHEKYTLQDHYVSSTPQIRTITPEEFPYFHSDEAFNRKATRQQYYREMRPENLAYNRFNNQNRQEYQPSNNFPDEPLSPNSEGWPSREHDLLNLSENLSAIPNTTRNNIPSMSPNNSFFDNSIANQLRNAEPNREEYIPSSLIDTEATRRRDYNSSRPSFQKGVGMRGVGTENQKQPGNMKRNARRAHIYHDSSDTDTEMREISPIERKNSRPQDNEERVRNYNTIREVPAQLEKTLSKPKEAMQVEESRLESNNKLNETNYEPEIRKKRQVISAKPNGYSRVRPEDSGIRVQEIFEGFGEKRPEKHIKGTTNADVKNENGSKKVKNGLPAKADTLNKNQNPEDLDQKSRQKLAAALRKKLKEKKYGIDLSSLNEKSSNLNLQKYVAKKTVQEQAFRISALPSTAESGKTSVSTGSLNLGINKDDAKPGSDLFKTMGPGKSDLFQQKDAKAPAPNAPTLEKKDSVAPAAQAQPGENKGGLFSNLPGLANKEEKKENPPAAPAQTNNTQTEAVPKPLIFGSAGLFAADENVPVQNPILVTRNQSIVPGAGEEPQLAKKDSAFPQTSSLFSQSSGKSLFANTTKALSGDQSKSVAESLFGKSGETKAEAPTKSFFSNFNSAPTEQKPAPEQKSTGLFASLGGLHAVPPATEDKSKQNTAAPQSQSQPQPQPQSEAPAENNSSIFSASSIFGGQSKPPPPPGQPLKKDDIRPTTVTDVPGASYTASLLFGPPDPNNSIPSPAPFPVQTQPAQPQAPQGNQGGGNLFSGFSGGNLLNQISSGSKANEGSSSSIFARFGQQASPPKGQTQGQNQSQSQGQGQGQTPSQTQAPAQTGTGSIFSNLMASKQQSNMNMGGTMFSPKKDGQTGQSSNSLFGNQSASTQENKPTLFGNMFANANANANAGGNMGGNTGNAQVSSGSGTSAGMFANIFNKGGNQGSSAPSLFRNS